MRLKNRISLFLCAVSVTVSFLYPFSGKISYAEGASMAVTAAGENPEAEETGTEKAEADKPDAETSEADESDAGKEEAEDGETEGASAAGEKEESGEAEGASAAGEDTEDGDAEETSAAGEDTEDEDAEETSAAGEAAENGEAEGASAAGEDTDLETETEVISGSILRSSSFSVPTLSYKTTSLGISSSAPTAGQVNTYGASGNNGVSTTWTVPAAGYYNITCYGSSGGYGGCSGTMVTYGRADVSYGTPGNGKIYGVKAYLEKGYTLTIHCGGTYKKASAQNSNSMGFDDGKVGTQGSYYCDSDDDHNTHAGGGSGGGSSYVSYGSRKIVSAAGGDGGDAMADYDAPAYGYGGDGGGTTAYASISGVAEVRSVIATGTVSSFHTGYITIAVVQVMPVCSITASTETYTNENVILTANISSTGSGLADAPYSWDGGDYGTSDTHIAEKNGTYTLSIKDTDGNTGSATYTVSCIDRLAPEAELCADITDWTSGDVTLTVPAEDAEATDEYAKSGLADMAYSWEKDEEGDNIWTDETEYTVSRNGTYSCMVRDAVGNTQTASLQVSNIDTTAPLMYFEKDARQHDDGRYIYYHGEDEGVGLADMPYSWDGGATWTAETARYVTANGSYEFMVSDALGNTASYICAIDNIGRVVSEEEADGSGKAPEIAIPILNMPETEAESEQGGGTAQTQDNTAALTPEPLSRQTELSFFAQPEETEGAVEEPDNRQGVVSLTAETGEPEPDEAAETAEQKPDRLKRFWKRVILYSVWMAVLLCGLVWLLSCLIFEHVTVYRREKGRKYHKAGRCAIVRKNEYKQINLLHLMQKGENRDYKIRFSRAFTFLHKNEKVLLRTYHGVELRNVEKEIEILSCNS